MPVLNPVSPPLALDGDGLKEHVFMGLCSRGLLPMGRTAEGARWGGTPTVHILRLSLPQFQLPVTMLQ